MPHSPAQECRTCVAQDPEDRWRWIALRRSCSLIPAPLTPDHACRTHPLPRAIPAQRMPLPRSLLARRMPLPRSLPARRMRRAAAINAHGTQIPLRSECVRTTGNLPYISSLAFRHRRCKWRTEIGQDGPLSTREISRFVRYFILRNLVAREFSTEDAAPSLSGLGVDLEPSQHRQREFARTAAHGLLRTQSAAERGPLGPAEDRAPMVLCELHATHARRLAVGHARDRARDGRRDAAGTAAGSALHRTRPASEGSPRILRAIRAVVDGTDGRRRCSRLR